MMRAEPAPLGLPFHSLPELSFVRDLEAFEGPILTELRGTNNAPYLEKWCTYHRDAVRFLVVRSDRRAIAEYLAGRMPMLDLLRRPNDNIGFLVDRTPEGVRGVQLVQVSELPLKYLPKPTAMHDLSLRPEWETAPQSFLVNTEWDAKLLSDIERLYLTVYAFNFFMDKQSEHGPPMSMHTYVLEGGFAYSALFRMLRHSVPKNDNARATSVAAASPGVLTIDAPAETAEHIAKALVAVAQEHVANAYRNLHTWSKLSLTNEHRVPKTALNDLRRLCEFMNVDLSKVLPPVADTQLTQLQLLRTGKVVAAYYRALRRLLIPKWDGVEFLAPLEVQAASAVHLLLTRTKPDDDDDDDDDDI